MRKYCWNHLSYIVVTICLIASIIGNNTSAAGKDGMDMDKLTRAVQKEHGTIIEWSLHTRELIENTSYKWTITEFKKQFPEWNWVSPANGKKSKFTGTKKHLNFVETIHLVTNDQKNASVSYISYEMSGKDWNKSISEKTETLLQTRMEQIFDKKPVVFSCIKGIFNEDHEGFEQSIMDELLLSLLAIEKEALREEDFYSISAYSSLFSQSLPIADQEMNLQVGLRKNKAGRGTSFTIGTPILTIEY